MPRYAMKIHDEKLNKDWYLEWSTIVDAPVTYGMSLEEFTEYCRSEYGNSHMRLEFDDRMKRVEEQGSSCYFDTDGINHYFEYNRAGKNETVLNKEGILDKYCRNKTA